MSEVLHDIDKLIEKGNECLNRAQPMLAARFFVKALEQRNTDTGIMDALAECFLGMGDAHKALPLIEKSIELEPESTPYKYLNMAQLEEGQEALMNYQTAIRIFDRMKENNESVTKPTTVFNMEVDNSDNQINILKELSKAYCGIAELYLTDLCDEENAEQDCESSLKAALKYDENNLDAKQTLASMRISQRNPEACIIIEGVYDEVYTAYKDNQAKPIITMVDGKAGDDTSNKEKDLPDPSFLLQTCKLLIECAQDKPDLATKAMDLLTLLLNENDEDPELWFVMGMGALACQPREKDSAKDAFMKSRALIEKSIERMEEKEGLGEDDDDPQMGSEEWQSYLELIDQQLSTLEIEDDEDQWEDIEEEEEEEG